MNSLAGHVLPAARFVCFHTGNVFKGKTVVTDKMDKE